MFNSKMMVLVLGRDELLLKLVRKHYVANKLKCKWFLYSDVDLAEIILYTLCLFVDYLPTKNEGT